MFERVLGRPAMPPASRPVEEERAQRRRMLRSLAVERSMRRTIERLHSIDEGLMRDAEQADAMLRRR